MNSTENELPFLYLDINNLKYYFLDEIEDRIKALELEKVGKINFKINLNNFIKDYIFLCYFLGNDFLPNIPSLSIKDNGIDTIISIYLDILLTNNSYLIDNNNNINNATFKELVKRLS